MTRITTAFEVNGVWYEMPFSVAREIQNKLQDYKNVSIINYIRSHRSDFRFWMRSKVVALAPKDTKFNDFAKDCTHNYISMEDAETIASTA